MVLNQLHSECVALIANECAFSLEKSCLLQECPDMREQAFIMGDSIRQGSIEKINKKYCVEVLLTLFEAKLQLKLLAETNAFLNIVQGD